ncbi:MAG: hypothetical protein ACKO8G_06860, partial [Actinomycetota bacterium]
MATTLQMRNFERFFRVWDSNDDGVITWDDMKTFGDRYAAAVGLAVGSPGYAELTGFIRSDWEGMLALADKDG